MALDLAGVATFLLEALPSMKSSNRESKEDSMGDDDMIEGDDAMEVCLNNDLERQICDAIDPRFLLQLGFHFPVACTTDRTIKRCQLLVRLVVFYMLL